MLRFSQLVSKNGVDWPWSLRSFGHFDSEFQAFMFNMALVYWSRPAKGCYTSRCARYLFIFFNLTLQKQLHPLVIMNYLDHNTFFSSANANVWCHQHRWQHRQPCLHWVKVNRQHKQPLLLRLRVGEVNGRNSNWILKGKHGKLS